MKVYRTDEIRNVVLLGHGGSGKTSLAEAMLYVSGAVSRMGKISESNTTSDFDKEEQKRGFSISTSLIPIEWEKAKINILDTPGYFDFVGEVEEAVSAADAAVIVVSGKAGVQVGTEKAWELCDKYNLPRMVYVTEMDMDDASFRQVVEDLTVRYGKKIAPHFQPIRENEKLVGYINIIKNAGRRYTGIGQREECEIPDYCLPNLKILRDSLMEAVAETSEEFMDRYFEGDEFSIEEIRAAMRTEVMDGDIVPVAMGSNVQAQGVANLLSDIVRFFPSPDKRSCAGIHRTKSEIYEADYDFSKAKSAYVFKTMVDPFIGKYSFVKVCSGVLKGDDVLYNADADAEEKPGKLYTMCGNKIEKQREIKVVEKKAIGSNNQTSDKIVYLTFDDGPSANTQKILDILDVYGAKATFFVTGNNKPYNHLIKTAHDKGHTIALHTYSHDYKTVYASPEAYFDDLTKVGNMVKDIIGFVPKYVRFPGGSSNTVSRKYCPGIMTVLSRELINRGYQYYDWNGDSTDASGNNVAVSKLIANATSSKANNINILFHDTAAKSTTVQALPAIIENYKARGYRFEAITDSSFVPHQGINN